MSGELSGGTEAIDVEGYLPNGEWRLVNVSAERMEKFYSGYDAAYLTIRYGIELKRQSMYYFFNLIVPSALIGEKSFVRNGQLHNSGDMTFLMIVK